MATSLNSYSTTALITNFSQGNYPLGINSILRIYPSTVPYPTSPVDTDSGLPAGYILSYSGLGFSVSGHTLIISSGTTAANSTAAGTLGWWASYILYGPVVISDSLSLSGGGGALTVSTMTPSSGGSVTISLNLSIV